MKKIFQLILTAFVTCISLCALFACGNPKIEGKYILQGGGGQNDGPLVNIMQQDASGNYINIVNDFFVPENFWVEIKGSTLTVHGLISPVTGPNGMLKFNALDDERKIENFKLETSPINENWYLVLDEDGEDTLWQILKNGEDITFFYGKSGGPELWYSISYQK